MVASSSLYATPIIHILIKRKIGTYNFTTTPNIRWIKLIHRIVSLVNNDQSRQKQLPLGSILQHFVLERVDQMVKEGYNQIFNHGANMECSINTISSVTGRHNGNSSLYTTPITRANQAQNKNLLRMILLYRQQNFTFGEKNCHHSSAHDHNKVMHWP